MNHNILHVTSFGHSLVKEYIYGKNQMSDTGPLGLLFNSLYKNWSNVNSSFHSRA